MKAFERRGETLVAELDPYEVALTASLVEQLAELLGAGHDAAPASDPFEAWAGEFTAGVTLDPDDPLISRLFPDAYDDDPVAAAEYRRFTQDALRRGRIEAAEIVLADLAATREGERDLVIALERVDPWVRTVNALRLSLAVRLGITDDQAHQALGRLRVKDPRRTLVSLYDWLGFVLESLLDAL